MDTLLAYLIKSLKTCDGQRDSAKFFIEAAVKVEVQKREAILNRDVIRAREKYVYINGPLQKDQEFCDALEWKKLGLEEIELIRHEKCEEIYR